MAVIVVAVRVVPVAVMLVMVMTMLSMTLHTPESLPRFTTQRRTLLIKKRRAEQATSIRRLWLVGRRSRVRPFIVRRV